MYETVTIATGLGDSLTDITDQVRAVVKERGVECGVCLVVVPHTTAAIVFGEETGLTLVSNMFYDVTPAAFRTLSEPARAAIARDNWFAAAHPSRSPAARPDGSRR